MSMMMNDLIRVFSESGMERNKPFYVAIDTSGGMHIHQCEKFIEAVREAALMLGSSTVTVFQFDTKVSYTHTFVPDNKPVMKLHGGGGTCLADLLRRVQEHRTNHLTIFTDGMFYADPGYAQVAPEIALTFLLTRPDYDGLGALGRVVQIL